MYFYIQTLFAMENIFIGIKRIDIIIPMFNYVNFIYSLSTDVLVAGVT